MGFVNIFQTKNSDNQCVKRRAPLLFSLFLALIVSAALYVDRAWSMPTYITVNPLSDINADGSPEVAVLVQTDNGTIATYVMDANTTTTDGVHMTRIQYPAALGPPFFQAIVPDMNGNGADEIAVLGVNSSNGKPTVYVTDSLTGNLLNTIDYNVNYPNPVAMVVVPNVGGTAASEIAVLSTSGGGIYFILTKDASSDFKIRGSSADFNDVNFPPIFMDVVSFSNGDVGLVALGVKVAGTSVKVVIKNVLNGNPLGGGGFGRMYFDGAFPPIAMKVVQYTSNTDRGIAVLGVEASPAGGTNPRVKVVIKEATTTARIGNAIFFDSRYPPLSGNVALAIVPDFGGDTTDPEISLFGLGDTSLPNPAPVQDLTTISTRDARTGTRIRSLTFHQAYPSSAMMFLDDYTSYYVGAPNGAGVQNGMPEVAVIGLKPGNGKMRISVKDSFQISPLGGYQLLNQFFAPPYYTTYADVSGLTGGETIRLRNNGVNRTVWIGNGTVAFTTRLADDGPYAVTMADQPVDLNQTCVVTGGDDGVGGGDINLANVTVTVTCTGGGTTYDIVATAGAGGSISPTGTTAVNEGDTQNYTVTPNANYRVVDVVVDGTSHGVVTAFNFTNVTATHTIDATFAVTYDPPPQQSASDPNSYNNNTFGVIDGAKLQSWKSNWAGVKGSLGPGGGGLSGKLIILQVGGSPTSNTYVDGAGVNCTDVYSFDAHYTSGAAHYAYEEKRSNGVFDTPMMVADGASADAFLKMFNIDPANDMVVVAMRTYGGTGNATNLFRMGRINYMLRYWGMAAENLAILNGPVDTLGGILDSGPGQPCGGSHGLGTWTVHNLPDNTGLQASTDEMLDVARGDYTPTGGIFLWDVRSANEYNGVAYSTTGEAGNYVAFEGTISYPDGTASEYLEWVDLVNVDGSFKSFATLKPMIDTIGNDYTPGEVIYTWCRTAYRSMVSYMAAGVILGYPVKNYDASWIEYGRLSAGTGAAILTGSAVSYAADSAAETTNGPTSNAGAVDWPTNIVDTPSTASKIIIDDKAYKTPPETGSGTASDPPCCGSVGGTSSFDLPPRQMASEASYGGNKFGVISGAVLENWKEHWAIVKGGLGVDGAGLTGDLVIISTAASSLYPAVDCTTAFVWNLPVDSYDEPRDTGLFDTTSMVLDGVSADSFLAEFGIDPVNDMVVVTMPYYSSGDIFAVGRVFYMLRYWGMAAENLAILNGDVAGNEATGDLTTMSASCGALPGGGGTVAGLPDNTGLQASTGEMLALARGDYLPLTGAFLWDVRSYAEYNPSGSATTDESGSTYVAFEGTPRVDVNATGGWKEWSDLVDGSGFFSSKASLAADISGIGHLPEQVVYTWCRTAYRSMVSYISAGVILGQCVKNYDGSWIEWGMLTDADNGGLAPGSVYDANGAGSTDNLTAATGSTSGSYPTNVVVPTDPPGFPTASQVIIDDKAYKGVPWSSGLAVPSGTNEEY